MAQEPGDWVEVMDRYEDNPDPLLEGLAELTAMLLRTVIAAQTVWKPVAEKQQGIGGRFTSYELHLERDPEEAVKWIDMQIRTFDW